MKPANKETIASFVRMLLSFIGSMLLTGGKHFILGQLVDTAYWQEITGVVMAAGSIIWSVATKTILIEQLEGSARQIIAFACGYFASKGIINAEQVTAIMAFLTAIGTWIQANFGKIKSIQIADGEVKVGELKGVKLNNQS